MNILEAVQKLREMREENYQKWTHAGIRPLSWKGNPHCKGQYVQIPNHDANDKGYSLLLFVEHHDIGKPFAPKVDELFEEWEIFCALPAKVETKGGADESL